MAGNPTENRFIQLFGKRIIRKVMIFMLLLHWLIVHPLSCLSLDLPRGEAPSGATDHPTALPLPGLLFQTISYTAENEQKADSVVIPLKRAGRLLLVEAEIDGETGNLVFDTGANGLVFNSTYFRNRLKSDGSGTMGSTGSVGNVEQVTIEKLEIAGLIYKNLRVDLTNLGHIENRRGVKILGLFGFNLIRNFEVQIDTRNNQLKLYRIDKSGKRSVSPKTPFNGDLTQKINMQANIVLLEGVIGGRSLTFCLDTGAESNVISSYCNKNVLKTLTITRRSGLHGVGSSSSEVLLGRMNDFSLGSQSFPGMETIVSNLDALGEAYGTKIDGMLGYSFLEQGVVCINFVKRQLELKIVKGEVK